MFQDRNDAGKKLAKSLIHYKKKKDTVVIGIPRGGVVTAYAIASELSLPLDIVLVKKLCHPSSKEFAIGSVSMNGFTLDESHLISEDYVLNEVKTTQKLLKQRYNNYYSDHKPLSLKNKTVILTDDGVATGNTLLASVAILKAEMPKKLIVAVPVAPKNFIEKISQIVDEFICLKIDDTFISVGFYYDNFHQIEDQEIKELLKKSIVRRTDSVS